jgi:hypothetical protein
MVVLWANFELLWLFEDFARNVVVLCNFLYLRLIEHQNAIQVGIPLLHDIGDAGPVDKAHNYNNLVMHITFLSKIIIFSNQTDSRKSQSLLC